MKGSVSKIVSKIQNNCALTRVALNAKPLLSGCGRVPYHTFVTGQRAVQSRQANVPLLTSMVNFNAKPIAHLVIKAVPASSMPREIVWLLGAPGSGKGTNSSHVAQAHGFVAPTIVMSSLLENPECKRIKDAGGMVDDATVFRALMEELSKPEYRNGVVVDGFPRTKEQAEWLRTMHASLSETSIAPKFSFVMLYISEQASIARQLSRGKAITELNNVRKMSGLEPLEVRVTDVNEAAARTRYDVFAEQYGAVSQLGASFPLTVVDADTSIESVRRRLSSALSKPSIPSSRTQLSNTSSFSNAQRLAFA